MSAVMLNVAWMGGWLQVQPQGQAVPWWVWIFGVVFLVFLVSGVWIRSRGKGVVKPEKDLVGAANEPKSQPRLRAAQAKDPTGLPQSDQLEVIEGIGPHIAGLLRQAGITRFTQLAEATPQQIGKMLAEKGLRVPVDPATWPEQARLAAAGQWKALEKLQAGLKAGRKIH